MSTRTVTILLYPGVAAFDVAGPAQEFAAVPGRLMGFDLYQ